MKKGQKIMTLTIGLICFVLSYVMFMQFKFVKKTEFTTIKNMRTDELKEELLLWKKKYEETEVQISETRDKIEEYKKTIENNQETSQLINSELQENKLALGKTNVEGEGVIIEYKDGTRKVTYNDLLKLVNELNEADAEAISINDQRVIYTTEIVEADSQICINGEKFTSPYTIKVIGNQRYLESVLKGKGRLVDSASGNGKSVYIETKNNIQIPKYDGRIKADNIK